MMEALQSILPQHEGLLPKWLLFVSVISIGNSIQAYLTTSYTKRIYTVTPQSVTPLSARTFGTWTFLSSIVRFYAAYYIDEPLIYQLALWTYVLAFAHFGSEWLLFKSAAWGKGLGAPVVVASLSLGWMLGQWGFYIEG